MAKKKEAYDNQSISSLKGAERVRKRPGVIFGSDGLEGCEHAVFEILSNSIDEARAGYGSKINVTRFADGSFEVEDFGRGIPVDYNKNEERYNWELVFCELYAGGKYKQGGDNYEFSLGLNGLGLCATQYSSEYMDVEIRRDGMLYTLHFKKGEIDGQMEKQPYKGNRTGTKIRWKPDLDVFTDIDVPAAWFQEIMKRQAVVNAGLTLHLKYQDAQGTQETTFLYPQGIDDYIKEVADNRQMTDFLHWEGEQRGRDRADKPEYKLKMQFALCFAKDGHFIEYYHNSSFLEHGGSPERAVKSAFVYQIDNYLKQSGRYTKNESKINFSDVEDCLILISSSFSTMTSYENQTKKSITNKFIADAMNEFLRHQLEVYFLENPEDAGKICEQVLVNKRARENAEKTKLSLKRTLSASMDVANRVQKFVDCRSRVYSERELYIVEGDSALGAVKQGRDASFQAIMPVRGKILNCLKAEYDKIFKSEIIMDLIRVLGCGVEVKHKAMKDMATFNLQNLRFGKVIICTDADVDGFQIRTLILTMLYRLTPTLMKEGLVYIAESPLYEITGAGNTYFAYNETEKAAILKELDGKKYTIQRSKGLGENEPDMMWATTMNPQTRRLIKVLPEDAERTARMFDVLLGDDLAGRKDFIAEFGGNYLELADIS